MRGRGDDNAYFTEVIKKMCNGNFQQRFKGKEAQEFMNVNGKLEKDPKFKGE